MHLLPMEVFRWKRKRQYRQNQHVTFLAADREGSFAFGAAGGTLNVMPCEGESQKPLCCSNCLSVQDVLTCIHDIVLCLNQS